MILRNIRMVRMPKLADEDAYRLYDEYMYEENIAIRERDTCSDCGGKMKQTTQDLMACIECGLCELEAFEEKSYMEYGEYQPRRTLYKRRLYCTNKLQLMACYKICRMKGYRDMITFLKDETFDDLIELKRLLKKHKYNKFLKYIYNIWFDIKGEKLISLTEQDISTISHQFVLLEIKFKNAGKEKHNRKNMICYNSLISILMKNVGNPGYEHVLLPNNHDHLIKVVNKLSD